MQKKRLISGLCLSCLLIVLLIVADYLALLGVTEHIYGEFLQVDFNVRDAGTFAPVLGVNVRCIQKHHRHEMCIQRKSEQNGIVSIKIPVQKWRTSSYLFTQTEGITPFLDPEIKIMFIHHNYINQIYSFDTNKLFAAIDRQYTIKIKPQQ